MNSFNVVHKLLGFRRMCEVQTFVHCVVLCCFRRYVALSCDTFFILMLHCGYGGGLLSLPSFLAGVLFKT